MEDLLFVNFKCMFCAKETPNDSLICDECASQVEFLNGSVCNKCGSLTDMPETTCFNCFNKKYLFDCHRSCITYSEITGSAVKALKYSKKKYLAKPIATFMYAVHKEFIKDTDYITFVPMTEDKMRRRGYNHMEVVAKLFGEMAGIPVVNFFKKVRDTEDQASLNYDERLKNIKGSFVIDEVNKDLIKGKNILVLDDVFTTGSTANECTKLLLKAKAYSVNVATFLKTDPNSEDELPL